jgi:hypothetical protein
MIAPQGNNEDVKLRETDKKVLLQSISLGKDLNQGGCNLV